VNEIRKLFKDILTGADNVTYDMGRVFCGLSHLVYFGMAFLSYIVDQPWRPMDFAGGIAAIAVGFGIHLNLKSGSEPKVTSNAS